jgi:hypothetical protein
METVTGDQTRMTAVQSPCSDATCRLGQSERVSIINALMAQDRTEIRERQEGAFKLTYYIIPAFAAIAASFMARPQFRWILLSTQVLLLLLYVVTFLQFRKWLVDARACLRIRESFYQDQELLWSPRFTPLRPITEQDRAGNIEDTHLWYPFLLTLIAGVVAGAYIALA